MTIQKTQTRRGILKSAAAIAAGAAGAGAIASDAQAQNQNGIVWQKKAVQRSASAPTPSAGATPPPVKPTNASPKAPMFNSIITFGSLVFLSGIGAHFEGTIEEHTKHVLDELEQNLIAAGSSMDKVLKVNVYLSDLANYARMNTAYAGRWGNTPPVRTTVSVAGVPGNSLVEIDCIASL